MRTLIHTIATHLASRCKAAGSTTSIPSLYAARTVVLVPYAQLMGVASAQWVAQFGSGFVPRFETTKNWARSLGGFAPEGDDLSFDMARDRMVAQGLLERAGLAAQQELLGGRVIEATWQLASIACAQAPALRSNWATAMQAAISPGMESPLLAHETVVARLALAWAGASAYITDALFAPSVAQSLDCLVVLDGLQSEPLTQALKARFADRLLELPLVHAAPRGQISLHAASGPEDEAERAAACVIRHIQAGRMPVALAATDRVLTRRVSALLAGRGVVARDETGWHLSTTRAGAQLMVALRACAFNAASDAVLDWLKHCNAFPITNVLALEAKLRKTGVRHWQALPGAWGRLPSGHAHEQQLEALEREVNAINALRQPMQTAQPLLQWLAALRALLQASGQWPALVADAAGVRVLAALCLEDGATQIFEGVPHTARRITLVQFTAWVNEVLEAGSFEPPSQDAPQVVVLPLAQLLGRPFAALVLPGCDEQHLSASPEPPGNWSPAQRTALGLSLRDTLQTAIRTAFDQALQMPHADVLWRVADAAGEAVSASSLVQALLLKQADAAAVFPNPDPRNLRLLLANPTQRPLPNAAALLPERLSASAYEDLRRCPYRFFALRQLGLSEADEIDTELDKRDFGSWLHEVLRLFHDAQQTTPVPLGSECLQLLDSCAKQAARHMSLDEAEFLPFSSAWPLVRNGYLSWLLKHETQGHIFEKAEVSLEVQLEKTTLKGRIDRIDRAMLSGVGVPYLLDYKTESLQTTNQRVKDSSEDTQLLFYAALLPDHELRAAYVNVGERETKIVPQSDVVAARTLLVEGIVEDMQAIADGANLPALGEAPTCDYCAARGLCRKDFWNK